MTRARVGLGFLLAVVGTAWVVGGIAALWAAVHVLAVVLAVLLVLLGLVVLIRAAIPRGMLTGPLVLMVAGAATLAVLFEVWRNITTGTAGAMVIAVGIIVAMSQRRTNAEMETYVKRYWIFLTAPEKLIVLPRKLIVRVLPGHGTLDLSEAAYPETECPVTVDCTILTGHLRLIVPAGWQVRLDRVSLTWAMSFSGDVDQADERDNRPSLFLNLVGIGGGITLVRR